MTKNPGSRGTLRVARIAGLLAAATVCASVFAACGSSSSPSASSELNNGVTAQEAGNYGTAVTDYTNALAHKPNYVPALFDLADVYQTEGKASSSQSMYEKVLALDPANESAMFNLAVLLHASDPSEAMHLYEDVIKLSPKDADAHFNLGYVLLALHQTNAGNHQLAVGVKLDPSLKQREG
jgi:tetratricopeptide (TPR) repeat protein